MPYLSYSPTKKTLNKHGQLVQKWKPLARKCVVCGTKFTTRNPNKLYCSIECGKQKYNKRRRK